jgi:glyoxylate reductase
MNSSFECPRVLVTSWVPEDRRAILESKGNVEILDETVRLSASDLSDLGEFDGWILRAHQRVDSSHLAACPSLKVLSNFAVGFDNIDIVSAQKSGIVVTNTPGVLDCAVAELVIGQIFNLGRKISKADRYVRDGSWHSGYFPLASDIRGKALGIVGAGGIGLKVGSLARSIGMRVIYHSRSGPKEHWRGIGDWVSWKDLFCRSDYISLHLPLNPDTRHCVGVKELSMMKTSAYLINTARGDVLDERALVDSLACGAIAGAALDVMSSEPLCLRSRLLELDNVVTTPHIGSATVETRRAMFDLAVSNCFRVIAGETCRNRVV